MSVGRRGNINKLLNRLLGCQVDIQSKIFSYFMALTVSSMGRNKANRHAVISGFDMVYLTCTPSGNLLDQPSLASQPPPPPSLYPTLDLVSVPDLCLCSHAGIATLTAKPPSEQ